MDQEMKELAQKKRNLLKEVAKLNSKLDEGKTPPQAKGKDKTPRKGKTPGKGKVPPKSKGQSDNQVATMEVPVGMVGKLIGRSGAKISALAIETNTKLGFSKAEGKTTQTLTIQGAPSAVRAAKAAVKAAMAKVEDQLGEP